VDTQTHKTIGTGVQSIHTIHTKFHSMMWKLVSGCVLNVMKIGRHVS